MRGLPCHSPCLIHNVIFHLLLQKRFPNIHRLREKVVFARDTRIYTSFWIARGFFAAQCKFFRKILNVNFITSKVKLYSAVSVSGVCQIFILNILVCSMQKPQSTTPFPLVTTEKPFFIRRNRRPVKFLFGLNFCGCEKKLKALEKNSM